MNLKKAAGKRLKTLFRLFRKKKVKTDSSLGKLQRRLGYSFNDSSLLTLALTHKSAIGAEDKAGLLSNERLEFLGDAVLNCLVTEHLFLRHPDKPEGFLSKIKSLLVSRKILGEIALTLDLGEFLILGASERKSGGRKRRSILSNAFEAVIGAVYLDKGLEPSRELIARFLFPRIDEFLADERHMNYKSKILELSQRDGFGIPHYSVLDVQGPEHAKQFTIGVEIAGVSLGSGRGPNKKIAQQNAAQEALMRYDKQDITTARNKGDGADELVSD
jgi:ribonuclease-3